MEKKEAREWIKCIIAQDIVISPNRARKLYQDAELPLPDHLQPRQYAPVTEEVLRTMERTLFGGDNDGSKGEEIT